MQTTLKAPCEAALTTPCSLAFLLLLFLGRTVGLCQHQEE